MAEALKDMYNAPFFREELFPFLETNVESFSETQFLENIFDDAWEEKALRERSLHITKVLQSFLSGDYLKDLQIVLKIVRDIIQNSNKQEGFYFEMMFLADYVSLFGLEYVKESVAAMETITQLISCEFAIRPFIEKAPDFLKEKQLLWMKHDSAAVRRLATEGFRPNLPWGKSVTHIKKEVWFSKEVLTFLKTDSNEVVRKSVANHLNDIAKYDASGLVDFIQQWKKVSPKEKMVKHAARTLLKKGHPKALEIFGFLAVPSGVVLESFEISDQVKKGFPCHFSFTIKNESEGLVPLRVEYIMEFLMKNGEYSPKVFYISEIELKQGQQKQVNKKHSFKPISTRTYYTGLHKISIKLNGQVLETKAFELID